MAEPKKNNPSGPKILRVGIVQRTKIIEEKELPKRQSVTVGPDKKSLFQVTSSALPKSVELFAFDGKQYVLQFTDSMDDTSHIKLNNDEAHDLPFWKTDARTTKTGDAYCLPLPETSRGKVVIGDVTVLFQFKAASPVPVQPALPSEMRGTFLSSMDAQFATIFVIVAVFHISFVAYARSLPYIEPTSIEEVGEQYQRMVMPDRAPEPLDLKEDTKADEKKDEEKKGEEPKKAPPKKAPKPEVKKPVDSEASALARKEALKKEVAGKGLLRVLGANRAGGSNALSDVFAEGGEGEALDKAFTGIQGVDIANSGGESGTRGGGSGEGVGIGDLKTGGGGNVNSGNKQEEAVRGAAKAETPEVDGELSGEEIAKVMRRQLKALQSCYEGALKRDRNLRGKLIIRFEILENGRTSNIEFEGSSLNSREVQSCIATRAKSWRFPKPDGGSVFVSYPIVFSPAAS